MTAAGNTVRTRRRRSSPSLQDVVVIAFAANRVARAVSVDEISEPLRQRLARRVPNRGDDNSPTRRFAVDLLNCPVCTGWWSSIVVSLVWPGRYRLRRGMAVAGVQVMLTLAERLVSEEGRIAVREAQVITDT